MASVNLFIYQLGDSTIHKMHPTLKILLSSLLTIQIVKANYYTLTYITILILFGFYVSKLSFKLILKDLRYVIFLSITLIFFQIIFSVDTVLESVIYSLTYVLRVTLMILLGTLFTGTTPPQDITPALFKIIKIKKIAEYLSLTIRLIPTFLISWKEIEMSLNSRGLYLVKNPFKIMSRISIPLLVETFKRADMVSMAMESRSYTGWLVNDVTTKEINIKAILFVTLPVLIKFLLQIKML
ncbi:MAG: energy-coupling factor transporter transmembrane protein EcfT [Spirochaetaceae bacterium]